MIKEHFSRLFFQGHNNPFKEEEEEDEQEEGANKSHQREEAAWNFFYKKNFLITFSDLKKWILLMCSRLYCKREFSPSYLSFWKGREPLFPDEMCMCIRL